MSYRNSRWLIVAATLAQSAVPAFAVGHAHEHDAHGAVAPEGRAAGGPCVGNPCQVLRPSGLGRAGGKTGTLTGVPTPPALSL